MGESWKKKQMSIDYCCHFQNEWCGSWWEKMKIQLSTRNIEAQNLTQIALMPLANVELAMDKNEKIKLLWKTLLDDRWMSDQDIKTQQ